LNQNKSKEWEYDYLKGFLNIFWSLIWLLWWLMTIQEHEILFNIIICKTQLHLHPLRCHRPLRPTPRSSHLLPRTSFTASATATLLLFFLSRLTRSHIPLLHPLIVWFFIWTMSGWSYGIWGRGSQLRRKRSRAAVAEAVKEVRGSRQLDLGVERRGRWQRKGWRWSWVLQMKRLNMISFHALDWSEATKEAE